MAKNPEYRLAKIEKVQKIYLQHRQDDVPNTKIYRNHIKDAFHISYRTYTGYLTVNVALERRKLGIKH